MENKILKELEQGFCSAYREYLMKSTDENHDYYRGYFSAFVTALNAAGIERAEEDVCYKLCDKVQAEQEQQQTIEGKKPELKPIEGWAVNKKFRGLIDNEVTIIECSLLKGYACFTVDGKPEKRKTHIDSFARQYFKYKNNRFSEIYEKEQKSGTEKV